MKKKEGQHHAVKGTFPCKHPRVIKSFFMKDENRPIYHCEVCMVELFPVGDDEAVKEGCQASVSEIVSGQKS